MWRSCTTGSVPTSAVTRPSPLFSLRLTGQHVEALPPELVQEGPQVAQPFRACAIEALRALPALVEQARLLQHAEVLGDRRARHGEVRGDLAGGELAFAHQLEDLSAAGLGEGVQRGLHTSYLSISLRKCQLSDRAENVTNPSSAMFPPSCSNG